MCSACQCTYGAFHILLLQMPWHSSDWTILFVLFPLFALQSNCKSPFHCSNDAGSTCQEVEICHSSLPAQAPNANGEGEAGRSSSDNCWLGHNLLRWQGVGNATTGDASHLAQRWLQSSLLSTDHRQLSLRWIFRRSMYCMINATLLCRSLISPYKFSQSFGELILILFFFFISFFFHSARHRKKKFRASTHAKLRW